MEWTIRSPPLASAVRESFDSRRSLLSAAVSLTRTRFHCTFRVSPHRFRNSTPSFPPPGPVRRPFPDFISTMGALRLLAALLAALRCLRLAIPCRHPSVRSCASSDALPHRPGLWYPGVPPALPSWRQRDLPGSWATRSTSALLSDPGRASVPSRCFRHVGVAPALRTTKAPAIILSWLNNTASVVAVYASSPGSPPTNARLASGCRLRSTGWDWLPTGWLRQVSDAYFTSSSPPRLGLARSESICEARGV